MSGSLYSLLATQHPGQLVPMRCRAPLLGRLVRYFEDLVVEGNVKALVVQGRCLDGMPEIERRRFCRLSAAANFQYIFACGPNCDDRTWSVPTFPKSLAFEQRDYHDYDTGPFFVIIHPQFSGLLASRRVVDADSDGLPFEMIWSFEPNVVYTALEYVVARISAQHREHLALFVARLRECAPASASLRMTLNLTTKLAQLLQRQTEIEVAISRLSSMISGTFQLEEVYQPVVDVLAKTLGVRRVALTVWEEHSHAPEAFREAFGAEPPPVNTASLEIRPPAAPIEVPVVARGVATGVLVAEDDSPVRIWEEEEVMMVQTVADHLAIGISNARLFRQVEEQAIRDELTGLYNRRYLQQCLEREMQFAQRGGQTLSLVLFDLDYMKRINDTYGHIVGDAVLRHIGATMGAIVRNIDICARYGGEEFVVVLPHTDQPGALLAAERMRSAISGRPFPPVGALTASFGVSTFPTTAASVGELVEQADRAMYVAKQSGRNRVAVPGDTISAPSADRFGEQRLDERLVQDGLMDELI